MTLVELLIVITIMALLLGMSIPMMKPAIEEGKIREGARQVQAQMMVARGRAGELGRTVAVWFERSAAVNNMSEQMFIAESPLPYCGDALGATGQIIKYQDSSGNDLWKVRFTPQNYSLTLPALVESGDRIKFDYKGDMYRINSVTTLGATPIEVGLDIDVNDPGKQPPPDAWLGIDFPYQVFRTPEKSLLTPLQLAGNAAIDLQFSGFGYDGRQFNSAANHRVLIAFSPEGGVEYVEYNNAIVEKVETIHLLVTAAKQVGVDMGDTPETPNPIDYSPADDTPITYTESIADADSVWISIAGRSGAVNVAENAWELVPTTNWFPRSPASNEPPYFFNSFRQARQFAQEAQSMGGW
jgi:type II secretory pathway pseudopilin PulG